MRQPVLFVGHGSPMNAIGHNRARTKWQDIGRTLGKPEVIIGVSAHWLTEGQCVRSAADNPQIYDMYGFPPPLYEVHYEPAGSPEYAVKALRLLGDCASPLNTWGIDHGIWSVLTNMYPEADVPVVMMSVAGKASTRAQYEVGQKIAPLREEGAMIICSGNVVHNLRQVNWDMDDGYPWADAFDSRIKEAILAHDFGTVIDYQAIADYRMSVPTREHFYPILTALGAAHSDDTISVWNDYRELGSMSMTSYTFG